MKPEREVTSLKISRSLNKAFGEHYPPAGYWVLSDDKRWTVCKYPIEPVSVAAWSIADLLDLARWKKIHVYYYDDGWWAADADLDYTTSGEGHDATALARAILAAKKGE